MKKTNLIFILSILIAVTGCSRFTETAKITNSATPETVKSNSSPSEAANKTADTPKTETMTGVAACDEYLTKVEKLLNNPKIPQTVRDTYKQTWEQNKTAWKQAASSPQGKQALETSCKTALDAIKPTLEQFDK